MIDGLFLSDLADEFGSDTFGETTCTRPRLNAKGKSSNLC